jgi:hypothetical protein
VGDEPGVGVFLVRPTCGAGVRGRAGAARRAAPGGRPGGHGQRELPEGVEFETLPSGEQRAIALRIVRREMGIMTIACLLIVAFALRAAQVSGELF